MISARSDSQPACSSRSSALGVALVLIALLAATGNALAAKPKITSPTTASGTIGLPFSYQITADQAITTWGASGLPAGLTVNTTNGLISGTPTATGTFSVGLSATNGNGTGTATLTLTINSPPNGLFVGFRLPDFLMPAGSPNNPRLMLQMGATQATTGPHPFNVTLEVDTGGGTWVPYNRFIGINDSTSWITNASLSVRDSGALTGAPQPFSAAQLTGSPPAVYMKADPRATRFGIFQIDNNPTANSRIIDSVWPLNSSTFLPNGYGGAVGTIVEHVPLRFAGTNYFPATLCINNAASTSTRTGYADADGIIRPADATYPDPSVATTGSSTPYNTSDYRPIILNRPFQNVAELGYAFRDLPWKSLDLFTEKSADAGLLDVFSIADEPAMTAGRVNLNTRQTPALQSVLAGANWDLTPTIINNAGIPTAQIAPTMATNITAVTSATPLKNKSELVMRAALPTTILPLPTTSQGNQTVKARREVVPRAISSISQTRVWNVLIDVVAQSGRYPPGETDPKKFIVEGEQHYWVHVAIDRFTGQVIDKQIEVVQE
jgi:Putative Ig domain